MNSLRSVDHWPVPSAAVAVTGVEGLIDRHGPFYVAGRWSSVTKLLTAYAVLMACEEGITDLDQKAGPVGSTIRHLLSHASGLPFEGHTPISPPNRRRIYSNVGFDLLGAHIAERSGMPFADYLETMILQPLGIDGELRGRPSEGFHGTVIGMAHFAVELLSPTLLSRATLELARSPAFPNLEGTLPGIGRFAPNPWGLGFELKDKKVPHWTGTTNSESTFGHFGGSGSFLWVDPVAGLGLSCMTGREFGPWALEIWPGFSDEVLAEAERLLL